MPFINFYSARPTLKLLIILLSVITIGIIVFFIGILLGRLIFWMHLDEVNYVLSGKYDLISDWQLKFFQLMQSIGFFLLPGIFLYWIFSTSTEQYFESRKSPGIKVVILLGLAFVVGMPLISWIVEINQNIELPYSFSSIEQELQNKEEQYAGLTKRLLVAPNIGHLLFNILMIAIIPAIGEEFLFRGVLQKLFKEITRNIHVSVLITAFIFSAVHGQFYGFVPRFLLGIFFGYLMVWSGTIWIPVVAHFINNAIAVVVYYVDGKNTISEGTGIFNSSSAGTIVISAGLFIAVLFLIRKLSIKEKQLAG